MISYKGKLSDLNRVIPVSDTIRNSIEVNESHKFKEGFHNCLAVLSHFQPD